MPVRRTQVTRSLVLRALFDAQERLRFDPCQISIDEPDCPDPLIVATENEREHTILLSALVEELETAGTPDTPNGLRQGVRLWLDTRPVPDKVAADKGLAILGWTAASNEPRWQVVVPRESGIIAHWVPTLHTSAAQIAIIRDRARDRSRRLTITPVQAGEVTMWVYMINPALSTACLLQPDRVCNGRPIEDMYAAVTPRRPVAVAPHGPAKRLVEVSTENHVLMPLSNLPSIEWN